MKPQPWCKHWANIPSRTGDLSTCALVSVTALLNGACFDECVVLDDTDLNGTLRDEESLKTNCVAY